MRDNEYTTAGIGSNQDHTEPQNEHAKKEHQGGSARPEKSKDPDKISRGNSTGPRTVSGKRRSSCNARTHGFFSRTSLLENESKTDYRFLVSALKESFQPSGDFEHLLIDDLAMHWMRKKRLLKAERAEIDLATDFIEVDLMIEQRKQLYEVQESGFVRTGQLSACSNPFVLSVCIALLEAIREDILSNKFDSKKDSKTLEFIYGLSWTVHPGISFLIACKWLMREAEADKLNPGIEANREYEEARQTTIEALEVEIERLRTMKEGYAVVQKRRVKCRKQAALIPSSEVSERLLRYLASWSRELERMLNLLDRLQRTRRGQPVPPAVRVEFSS